MSSYKIIDEPGSGKTKKLMKRCYDEKAVFVCKNPEAMEVKAYAYGYNGLTIISYLDFLQDSSYKGNNVYLDDIDEFLSIIGCYVKGFGGNI